MVKCKITVLKRTLHQDLVREYCQREVGLCTAFNDGQEFFTDSPTKQPEDFSCGWAWIDIHRGVLTLMQGGNFGSAWQKVFKKWKWMKTDDTLIMCCTDGIRPVIFKIERIDDD